MFRYRSLLSTGVRRSSLYEGRLKLELWKIWRSVYFTILFYYFWTFFYFQLYWKYLINNEWKESAATEYVPVHNPATQVN